MPRQNNSRASSLHEDIPRAAPPQRKYCWPALRTRPGHLPAHCIRRRWLLARWQSSAGADHVRLQLLVGSSLLRVESSAAAKPLQLPRHQVAETKPTPLRPRPSATGHGMQVSMPRTQSTFAIWHGRYPRVESLAFMRSCGRPQVLAPLNRQIVRTVWGVSPVPDSKR